MKFCKGDLVMTLTLNGIATGYDGDDPPSEYGYHKSYIIKERLGVVLQRSIDWEWCRVLFPVQNGLIAWIAMKRLRSI